jgi:hypothetical protein
MFAQSWAFIQISFERLPKAGHLFKSVFHVCPKLGIYSNQF